MQLEPYHLRVRLPPDVKTFLERRSRRMERSQSAHIVFLLRQDLENEKGTGAEFGDRPDASHQ